MKKKCGVYKIINVTNGKAYVGSAVDVDSRRRNHLRELLLGKHHSKKLQNSWNKYGSDQFVFVVVELVSDQLTLRSREQYWIDGFDCAKYGYNILPMAGSMSNFKLSEETKRKISASKIGRTMSESARAGLLLANKRKKQSLEQLQLRSSFMTGRKPSEKHLEAQIKAIRSKEVREKISRACKGIEKSQEHLAKIRESLQKPEVQMKLRARVNARTGAKLSDQEKENLSQQAKQRWADPQTREKYIQSRIARAERSRNMEAK